ncbi:unnamed protein product [Brachionus calyciflorus]|uniref:Hormone-sensitive lipase n=1 Tax=Brachionus calyciflorus TaxID=104777 RepID=A0A813M4Q4_9BILA|nr:unnamed protein product [Brachionus calyciflorus]
MKLVFKNINKRFLSKKSNQIIESSAKNKPEKQLIKSKYSISAMDAFKNLKNYINPNLQDQEMSPESPRTDNELKTRIHKSFNDSTKRISTLLKFRSVSVKTDVTEISNTPAPTIHKRVFRPKFLRSKSFHMGKKNPNDSNIINVTNQSEQEAERENLFKEITSNLEELQKHFSQSLDETLLTPNFNFMETTDQSAQTYFKLTSHAKTLFDKCLILHKQIEENLDKFDIDPNIKANGFRSLLKVFESSCYRLLTVLNDLNEKKNKFYFQLKLNNSNLPSSFLNSNLIRDLQTWVRLMEKLEIFLETGLEMQKLNLKEYEEKNNKNLEDEIIPIKDANDGPSLFVHLNQKNLKSIENKLFNLASIHQEAFFGRACGFQFCDSLQRPMTGCAIALASYNDGFEAFSNKENTIQTVATLNGPPTLKRVASTGNTSNLTGYGSFTNSIGKAAMSVYSSTKYIMDPELRAKKLSHIMRKANVEFCKAFWQLTETSIVQMGSNLVTPTLPVNLIKKINLANPLRLPKVKQTSKLFDPNSPTNIEQETEFVEISPPNNVIPDDYIRIRILSNEIRQGMQDLDKIQSNETSIPFFNNQINFKPPSRNLILHVHGGGFIAHSSKSHEIYLKPWCKELKVPIVSVDYSLAPEHAFPRASEECFYVYAWCLKNKELLGWTGENIICVGDSAGGVLVTNIVQRAINNEIRVPDGLVPIYAPFLLTYSLSPSRLLSVMDPLLNLGILWRCLAAYSGIDFNLETERYKQMLDLSNTDKKLISEANIKFSRSESFHDINKENDQNEKIISESQNEERIDLAESQPEYESDKLLTKEELLHYYTFMGESIFLIDKLRSHKVPYDQYMSPMLSSDTVLSKFPRTCLIGCNDPFLDDSLEMYRRLIKLNVKTDLLVVDNGSPHGFLNMQSLAIETHEAYEEVLEYLRNLFIELDMEKHTDEDINR